MTTSYDRVGLCRGCRNAHMVKTPRSEFWLCRLSASDARFEKYPRLPVKECPGYAPGGSGGDEETEREP